MKKIVIAHNKGGVGKSTLSMNTAYALRKLGYRVGLFDSDKQGTTFACAQNMPVFTSEKEVNPGEYDYLVIDTPPYLTSTYLPLFIGADIVVIPTAPSPADVIEIEKTASVYHQAKYKNSALQCVVVFNMNDNRNTMLEMVRPQVEKSGLRILDTVINRRVSFARTLLSDEGVFSEPDSEAHKEMRNFTNEIISLI